MKNSALKLTEIHKGLSMVSLKDLDEIKQLIDSIVSSRNKTRKAVHLKGIWAAKGFEKLNVQRELKVLRKEVSDSIVKRKF